YDEREFRTEAGAILGEYRKNRANPFFTLFEGLSAAAFDVHPYRHTTMGLEADIRAMPERYTYSLEFFRRFYRPDNTVLLVAGDVDPDHVIALVEQHYAGWEPGYQPPAIPVEPPQDGPRRTAVPFPGRTLPVLALAWRSPAFAPADRLAVAGELVAELAVGATSPAYEELVLDRQVVDLLTPALHPTRDPGLWTVVARVTDPA